MRDLEHAQPRPDAVDDCSTNSSSDRDAVVVDCCAKPVFSAKSTTDSTCDNSTSSREDYPMNDWVLVRPQHEQERASSSGTGESVDAGSVDGGRNSYQPMVQDSSRADTCRGKSPTTEDCNRLHINRVKWYHKAVEEMASVLADTLLKSLIAPELQKSANASVYAIH